MSLTREEVFALIDETIFTNNSAQVQAADVNTLLKTIYDNAPVPSVGFEHYIGESFGGGVIFHLWKDTEGAEHGLIVDRVNLSSSQAWSNVSSTLIGTSAQSPFNGLANSNAIVAQSGHTNSAAKLCLDSTNMGFNDWYLPASGELKKLFLNYYEVSKSLFINAFSAIPTGSFLLSSNELFSTSAYVESLTGPNSQPKNGTVYTTRAIRQF
jgi:hypothetical protein